MLGPQKEEAFFVRKIRWTVKLYVRYVIFRVRIPVNPTCSDDGAI